MRPSDGLQYYVYIGGTKIKKIHGTLFKRGEVTGVWDRKTHILIRKLPYVRQATPEEIAKLGGGVIKEAKKKVKPAGPKPEVPDGWWTLHHLRRLKLAKAVSGMEIQSVAEGDTVLEAIKPRPVEAPASKPETAEAR